MKMKQPVLSRRSFLKASAAAVAVPTILPSSVFGANAPSNRIVMGAIGVGSQGSGNLNNFLGRGNVQVVGVCDVDAGHLQSAKNSVDSRYGNKDCAAYKDFRELLARGDLDAISMATPDHWHALTAIASAKAGCDVYGEKPFTHDLREGRALSDTVARHGRIWQTGSWQRSGRDFHFACELVRNGRIGKIHTVEVGLPTGGSTGVRAPVEVPRDLDWNFWVGPSPWAPYRGVSHWDWRWMMDFGGGQLMDWIGHHGDIAQWGLGTELTGPVEVEGSGTFPEDGIYDAAMSYKCTCKYANGVTMIVANDKQQPRGMGTRWIGDEGWVWVDRGGLDAEPKSLLKETIGADEIRLYRSTDHWGNFLDCVRSRRPAITPAEVAHRSASIGHLCVIAMVTGRKIRWNPEKEEILNDPGASALLGRACREPWSLSA